MSFNTLKQLNFNRNIMRKLIYFVLVVLTTCCEKENDNCNIDISGMPKNHLVSNENLDFIKYLFNNNNLDYNNYLFYSLQNELGNHYVRSYQYINNKRVFSGQLIFHFDDSDKLHYIVGNYFLEIDTNATFSPSLERLRELYINELEQNNSFDYFEIINGCLSMELGYYDLNAGINNTEYKFRKAWKIKPLRKSYPYAYIDDNNSQIIGFYEDFWYF